MMKIFRVTDPNGKNHIIRTTRHKYTHAVLSQKHDMYQAKFVSSESKAMSLAIKLKGQGFSTTVQKAVEVER